MNCRNKPQITKWILFTNAIACFVLIKLYREINERDSTVNALVVSAAMDTNRQNLRHSIESNGSFTPGNNTKSTISSEIRGNNTGLQLYNITSSKYKSTEKSHETLKQREITANATSVKKNSPPKSGNGKHSEPQGIQLSRAEIP